MRITGACNPSTQWEAEARGSEDEGHPQIRRKFEVCLEYMRPCLKIVEAEFLKGVSIGLVVRKKSVLYVPGQIKYGASLSCSTPWRNKPEVGSALVPWESDGLEEGRVVLRLPVFLF